MTMQTVVTQSAGSKHVSKSLAPKRLGTVTRSLIAGGAMDVFQGDEFIWAAPEATKPDEISVRAYQRITKEVRQAIEAGEDGLVTLNARRALASTMLAVQSQALALDVAKQQINLLRLDMLEADPAVAARLQEEIVLWQSHAETLRDGLDASRDQLDHLRESTGISF